MNSKKHILIVGYYNSGNAGDDAYIQAIPYIIGTNNIYKFVNINLLKITSLQYSEGLQYDIVMLGGGDVINNYFLDIFIEWWTNVTSISIKPPLYAFSIGVPYPSQIDEGRLDIFDMIFVRHDDYVSQLENRFQNNNIFLMPDAVFSLYQLFLQQNLLTPQPQITRTQNILGVYLSQSIYNSHDIASYDKVVQSLSNAILQIARTGYSVILFSMNTDSTNLSDNDIILNTTIETFLKKNRIFPQKINVTGYLPIDTINKIKSCSLNICMKYHSIIFSILFNIPFMTIFSTKKVQSLIKSLELQDYGYQLPIKCEWEHAHNVLTQDNVLTQCSACDALCGYPIDCDTYIITLFNKCVSDTQFIKNKCATKIQDYITNPVTGLINISEIINDSIFNTTHRLTAPSYISHENILTEINDVLNKIKIDSDVDTLTEMISNLIFEKTNNTLYGLKQDLASPSRDLTEIIKYCVKYKYQKIQANNFIPQNLRIFNFNKFNQEKFAGYHRYGWKYVMDYLESFNRPNSTIIFDGYVDKTFFWDTEHREYKSPWIGVVHHTDNEDYTPYNIKALMKQERFINSLPMCKGLFVLSESLKSILQNLLPESIKVNSLVHPTYISQNGFSIQKYANNTSKKIICIGGWYRDSYKIYALQTPPELQKVYLKGKDMDNYFQPPCFNVDKVLKCQCYDILPQYNCDYNFNGCGSGHQNQKCNNDDIKMHNVSHHCWASNKYMIGLLNNIKDNFASVEIHDYVDNDTYDDLLSQNLVFLDLIDASAVNTVLECIARNTPILVNPLPAVIEMLGPMYPLYYSTLYEASLKLSDISYIQKANLYLQQLDKTKFTINYFLNSFINSDIVKSLLSQ